LQVSKAGRRSSSSDAEKPMKERRVGDASYFSFRPAFQRCKRLLRLLVATSTVRAVWHFDCPSKNREPRKSGRSVSHLDVGERFADILSMRGPRLRPGGFACGVARTSVCCSLVCLALASCAVGPDYHPPNPLLPHSFLTGSVDGAMRNPNSNALETARWWRIFSDPELDSLVERAIASNPNLEMALDRLEQARSQEAVVIGTALPVAEGSAGGGWGTGSDLARGRASQNTCLGGKWRWRTGRESRRV
jgi:hypothetical protein